MPTEVHNFHLPIRTEETLREFVALAFGVHIPDAPVCPTHSTPWRAFADAYFAKSRNAVWKASRGFGGKTFLMAVLAATEAATLGANVSILGGSGEQSSRVLAHSQKLWEYPDAPRSCLASAVAKETRYQGGNRVHALMASQASVRGPHPQRLRIDEADEVDLAILDAATGQPMEAGSGIPVNTVFSSTHQYPDGTMTELLRRAHEKDWPVYEWCYKETLEPHGWLTPAECAGKRDDVTDAMWATEYDLQEPSPENRAIMPDKVEAMFDARRGVFAGRNREYLEVEAPVAGATYATGADWAKKQDWGIILTLRTDLSPCYLVAFERVGRMPWPAMIARFEHQVQRYKSRGKHDKTGLGDVVHDYLPVNAEGVIMVGKERADLFSQYIVAIEAGRIVAPRIEWMYKEHSYCSTNDLEGSGHPPDSVVAGALAWSARKRGVYLG